MGDVDEKTKDVVEKNPPSQIKILRKIDSNKLQNWRDNWKLRRPSKKAIKDIEFYENNDNCPTCKQGLDSEHKKKHIKEKEDKIAEIKTVSQQSDFKLQNSMKNPTKSQRSKDEIDQIQKEDWYYFKQKLYLIKVY